ncbi:MAG: GH3 auxin-responsive promoter [Bacteroidetes bacterium]|nr:MAG: GH3 auxin-responsive promoter [Bacteroidota bacterium]
MKIIGKLLKKTTEIGYLRQAKKGRDYRDQLETLRGLLEKAKATRFGVRHDFSSVLKEEDPVKKYQKKVPITDYDEFHENWLKGSILGVKDNTWPGRIKYYALSSGTTGSPSKRIPVTEEMIRSFQKSSMRQITMLHELDLPDTFFNASVLTVGGSTKLTKKETHIEGDLSGILKKHTSFILSPFAKPGNRISGLKDWNQKLEKMIEKAPDWNIGVIAGVPSWCIMLMEKIVEHYNLNSIHDIWPNFQVYVHGGVFMEPYMQRLEKVTAKKVHLLDTYLASEGYFGYQTSTDRKGMQLLLHTGVFFEFVPFNANYFDQQGELKDKHVAYTLAEVKEGVEYAMVISTNAGLWRYMIGDLIKFVNVEEREIQITGRIKQYLSLCGEHLSLDNINQAINEINRSESIGITEFCIIPSNEEMKHYWFIGLDEDVDPSKLMDQIDRVLKSGNDDYAAVRKYTLSDPEIRCFKSEVFYRFMESIGKTGAQNKVPRVMNAHQSELWLNYLRKEGLL